MHLFLNYILYALPESSRTHYCSQATANIGTPLGPTMVVGGSQPLSREFIIVPLCPLLWQFHMHLRSQTVLNYIFVCEVPVFRSSYLNKEKYLANNKLTCATSTHYRLIIFMIHPEPPQTVPCHPMHCKLSWEN